MIINALIIVFLFCGFYINVFAPVKGIQQIATMELKAKLKNKNNQFIDVRTPHEFRKTKHIKRISKQFLYQNCRPKQASFQKAEK